MNTVSGLEELDFPWKQQYRMLAKEFARLLPKSGMIVEVGCGEGQLTIPLARLVRSRFVTVDSFAWPYATGYRSLLDKLSKQKLKRQITLVKRDYRNFLLAQKEDLFGAVISSEFLPEIDSKQTPAFLSECHRILKPDGITVHSFLSSVPKNKRQSLLIEADTNPKWTKTPPEEWFSPTRNLVTRELRYAGFKAIKTFRLESNLVAKGEAARQLLRDWDVKEAFWKSHKPFLISEGLEIPDWIICTGRKS